jgi:hypothetical protein
MSGCFEAGLALVKVWTLLALKPQFDELPNLSVAGVATIYCEFFKLVT